MKLRTITSFRKLIRYPVFCHIHIAEKLWRWLAYEWTSKASSILIHCTSDVRCRETTRTYKITCKLFSTAGPPSLTFTVFHRWQDLIVIAKMLPLRSNVPCDSLHEKKVYRFKLARYCVERESYELHGATLS